jgi:hypothetical protein
MGKWVSRWDDKSGLELSRAGRSPIGRANGVGVLHLSPNKWAIAGFAKCIEHWWEPEIWRRATDS